MRKAMFLLAVFGLVGLLHAADNPFIGTWKLNLAKTKGTDLPKSEIIKNVVQGKEIKTIVDSVDAQGKTSHSEGIAKWDGKDYPVTGDPEIDTAATTIINANTISAVTKKAGKEIATYRITASKDGKTLTLVGKAKDAKGQEVSFTGFYDKQ
jgi:hypothetical protein